MVPRATLLDACARDRTLVVVALLYAAVAALGELAAVLGADRFLREIEIAARLRHPHALPLVN